MGLLDRLFGNRDPQADFARHIPVLAEVGHNISLGIYWRLSKRYEKQKTEVDPCILAYAIVYDLTQNDNGARSLGDFPLQHRGLIMKEVRQAAGDPEIREALSLEYSGRLMALSWNNGPFSEDYAEKLNAMTVKATALGFAIEDIVSLWGSKAIANLQAFAREFRQQNA